MAETTLVEEQAHDHPSDWAYVKIALLLAAITAVEVLTYFESAITVFENNSVTIASLMVMMVVKFYMVAMYFMHLKHDNPLFTRLFAGGLALAVAVYVIALSAFEFWA
ncbi:MAG: hypothetical protein DHS20C19_01230 [Acidimicrobiales bacterium]|nr:MAG: hypothetical protein DHS20C19_01230 [Acidimicrobiales bacterium]